MTASSQPVPFRIEFPDEELARMKRIIADTRLPDVPAIPDASWNYGVDLMWLKDMRERWLEFDWRKVEKHMNEFNHFKVTIESVELHYMHHKSERRDAVPILFAHGWPGSFWEFHEMIPLLTNPPNDRPAFHVIVPSLPGFHFSGPPPKQGWTMADNARILNHLLTDILGYKAYMAQGGDFGSFVATFLGDSTKYPACKMVNLNMAPAGPSTLSMIGLGFSLLLPSFLRKWLYQRIYSDAQREDFKRSWKFARYGLGSFVQQATRPLTIGYALYDSPIGILAWMGEKFPQYVDPSILPNVTNEILTNVTMYYLTRSVGTAALPYYESTQQKPGPITVPLGLSRFAKDILIMPISWVRATHKKVVFVRRHEDGGHFPGMEVPGLLVGDLQDMVAQNKSLFK